MGYYFPSSSGSVQAMADYVITKVGSNYISKNAVGSTVSSAAAFHTVLNATINLCTSGGKIFISTGVYTVTASIVGGSKDNIEIELARKAVLTLGNNADTHVFYLDAVEHWWIHGGEINGNEANQTTPGGAANTNSYGFFLNDTNDIKISDMYIHECCRAGIKTQGTGGGTYAVDTLISNCNISDCNWSGVLPDTNTKGMIVIGCLFVGDGEGGVAGGTVSPIWDVTVDSCTCHDMVGGKAPVGYEAGIYIEAGSQIKVVNNHCFNCKVGIFVTADGDYRNIIANNTVHDCSGNAECPGILIKSPQTIISGNSVTEGVAYKPLLLAGSGSDHFGSECVITGNFLYSATANVHGLQVVRSDNVIVANNLINVTNKAIMIMTNSSNCNITANRVITAALGLEIDNANCIRNWVDSNNFDGTTNAATDAGTNTRYGSNVDHAGAIVIAGMP